MLEINITDLAYHSDELGLDVKHYALIADYKNSHVLLSIPNLYLYQSTRSSISTSKRYATVISKFYRFLSTQPEFKPLEPGDYHVGVTNRDIRRWQVWRQIERVRKNSAKPTSSTIYNDALIIQKFFSWISTAGFTCNVKLHLRTWTANFKSDKLLNYIKKKARISHSGDPIRVLDKESRQHTQQPLISDWEIKLLLQSYPDTVYATLFCFALATAMRPSELVKFPYLGNGNNRHIVPHSQLPADLTQVTYETIGKGNKLRKVTIPKYALADIEKGYTEREYKSRCKKYKALYGKPCPLSILFLTKEGHPVTAKMIADATTYAKKLAHSIDPRFSLDHDFYQSRHWWPTMMMVQHHGERLLTDSADVLDRALAQVLMNQMGHNDIATTYKYYLNLARWLVMARQGHTFELVGEDFNIHSQIQNLTFQHTGSPPD